MILTYRRSVRLDTLRRIYPIASKAITFPQGAPVSNRRGRLAGALPCPDVFIITNGTNRFTVSYAGGDGNDLILAML